MATITGKVLELRPDQIRVMEGFNPRIGYGDMTALKNNIAQNGIQNPVKVRETKEKTEDGAVIYDLITGHRRLRSAVELTANMSDEYVVVPAIAVDATLTMSELRLMLLAEDSDQKEFNMLEQAYAIKAIMDDEGNTMKKADIARAIGKSQTYVNDCLFLIENATPTIIKQIKSGKLTPTSALELLKSNEAEEVEDAVEKAAAIKNPGKAVTKKDVEKVTDGKVTAKKKGGSAAKQTSKGATAEAKPTGGRNASAISELEGLRESLLAQEDLQHKEGSFEVLDGIIDLLSGKRDAIELVDLFFVDTDGKKSAKTNKENPKKINLREELKKLDEEEKGKKKAATKKTATKKAEPVVDDDEDDLDEAPAPKKKAAVAKPSKSVHVEVDNDYDELEDEPDSEIDDEGFDDLDYDDLLDD